MHPPPNLKPNLSAHRCSAAKPTPAGHILVIHSHARTHRTPPTDSSALSPQPAPLYYDCSLLSEGFLSTSAPLPPPSLAYVGQLSFLGEYRTSPWPQILTLFQIVTHFRLHTYSTRITNILSSLPRRCSLSFVLSVCRFRNPTLPDQSVSRRPTECSSWLRVTQRCVG